MGSPIDSLVCETILFSGQGFAMLLTFDFFYPISKPYATLAALLAPPDPLGAIVEDPESMQVGTGVQDSELVDNETVETGDAEDGNSTQEQ